MFEQKKFRPLLHCGVSLCFAFSAASFAAPQFVGNITTNGSVRSDFVQYWNQITPENEGKWGSVERSRDVYNWSGQDEAYNYAQANGLPFKAHTFVWGSQFPSWINNLSNQEKAEEIEEWIRDYCARYPNTDIIDVVNESTPGHAPAAFARDAFGSNWIIRSFELARQYCPNATLVLNDYNVLRWNTDEFIAMARPAVNAGVVDALGAQAHGLESMSLSELRSNLAKIADLGLPIYISEYDVNIANDQDQLATLSEQFQVFYNHPQVVGITLWGYVVGATWRDNTGLIQSNGSFRPAMTWLMDFIDRNGSSSSSSSSSSTSSSSSSSSSTSSTSSSSSSSSSSSGGPSCDGVNVYPNWTASNWGNVYDHAEAGDLMSHNNNVYRANWYTTTVPGSDDSWTFVSSCDGTSSSSSSSTSSSSTSSSSSSSTSSSSGGEVPCSGVNDYPNWTSSNYAGGPNDHAKAGDEMTYQGSLYRANWYTSTVPGSDTSWTLLGSCGG